MYKAGQIIDKKEHISFANWKNANGGNLISVSLGGGKYRLEEYKASEKTTEELAQEKRAERDSTINSILWRIERYNQQKQLNISTTDTEEEYLNILKYIQYLRDVPLLNNFPNIDILTYDDWKINNYNNE